MKKYTTLLFDADETLLDFGRDETDALSRILDECGIEKSEENISTYKEINQGLWKALERGEIDKPGLKKVRFRMFFDKIGYTPAEDPFVINERYLSYLGEGGNLLAGAKELISELNSDGYNLYIVTNGIEKTQKKRLGKAGILSYFKELFVSETIGHQKPKKEYFDYVLAHISERDKSKVLLIGDSLTSDIKGALNADIPCAWLRHNPAADSGELKPDFIIANISEVKTLL
ncbi:MAG: YjjG family noncanonical pyrimidine nucleotidase [Clostridia bacterium]|nr:YjjG family noncanonical pyrimidine nucleotidase [Clostridia bacterium]